VLAMKRKHYEKVNGYSNEFWGWGGEDDDIGFRILANNLTITRPSRMLGRYRMIKHAKRLAKEASPSRFNILRSSMQRWRVEGLRSNTARIVKVSVKPLYFHLTIDVGPMPQTTTFHSSNETRTTIFEEGVLVENGTHIHYERTSTKIPSVGLLELIRTEKASTLKSKPSNHFQYKLQKEHAVV